MGLTIYLQHVKRPEHAVAHLVEALRFKPECRGFDSRCGNCNISLIQFFRQNYDSGVDLASNVKECQKHFLGGDKSGRSLCVTTWEYQEYFLRVKTAGE